MAKNTLILTESEFNNLIKECVINVLNEENIQLNEWDLKVNKNTLKALGLAGLLAAGGVDYYHNHKNDNNDNITQTEYTENNYYDSEEDDYYNNMDVISDMYDEMVDDAREYMNKNFKNQYQYDKFVFKCMKQKKVIKQTLFGNQKDIKSMYYEYDPSDNMVILFYDDYLLLVQL